MVDSARLHSKPKGIAMIVAKAILLIQDERLAKFLCSNPANAIERQGTMAICPKVAVGKKVGTEPLVWPIFAGAWHQATKEEELPKAKIKPKRKPGRPKDTA